LIFPPVSTPRAPSEDFGARIVDRLELLWSGGVAVDSLLPHALPARRQGDARSAHFTVASGDRGAGRVQVFPHRFSSKSPPFASPPLRLTGPVSHGALLKLNPLDQMQPARPDARRVFRAVH
jgi:hypothetical protein